MLQVARLAANPLRDSAELVTGFVHSQLNPAGGFVDRAGIPDLYYTVFGIECLVALRRELPSEALRGFLRSFGDGDELDLVHLTSLARGWSAIGDREAIERLRPIVLGRLAAQPMRSVYDCFLATGAAQDLGAPLPDRHTIDAVLHEMAVGDGSYTNDADITIGSTPATAAAVTLQHQLELPIDPRSGDWLAARCHEDGGFFAIPGAPMPDLLSTAVALHALASMGRGPGEMRERCLDFLDTLWTSRGSFFGNWAEESLDVEYTWYGLLSLGHLCL